MEFPELLPGYRGPRGLNFYETDADLRREIESRLTPAQKDAASERLSRFGALCGNELGTLIETAHQADHLPRLIETELAGEKIPSVLYCDEQTEARRLFAKAAYEDGPFSLHERLALSILANYNGEGGITCPFAMTEGLIGLLEKRGTAAHKRECLPLLRSTHPKTALTAGQFVTERQGGSNVSANETVAKPQPDGAWALSGLKWFCSNPGALWVTTAKTEGQGHIALFLVRRLTAKGKINGHRILRLKAIGGTKGKATVEVEYSGARAEMIGRVREGLSLLVREILSVSRIHVSAAAVGHMSRAILEARTFARWRQAYGRVIQDFPSVRKALEAMVRERRSCLRIFFAMADAVERKSPLAELLIPLAKIEMSRRATAVIREAQLLIGGHGILEDFSILPRLADDSIVNEIWEGTHPILASHAGKALRRPAVLKALLELLACAPAAKFKELQKRVAANRIMDEDERNTDDLELTAFVFSLLAEALLAD